MDVHSQMRQVFMGPLSKSNIVTSMELSQIFANLSSLCALHSDVVAALGEITTNPPEEQNVGRVFLEHVRDTRVQNKAITYCVPRTSLA